MSSSFGRTSARLALVLVMALAVVPTTSAAAPAGDRPSAPPSGRVLGRPAPVNGAYAPGQVLVRFSAGAGPAAAGLAHASAGAVAHRALGVVDGLELATLASGKSVEDAITAYEAMPGVLYAEPNYLVYATAVPGDTSYGQLWGLHNTGQTVNGLAGTADADIDAPEAWDETTGTADVVVAVVDTGVDYNHPDLAGNMWVNAAEAAGTPGVDDDANGYVDDIHGADTVNNDGDPADDYGHGTHCAGTVAAEGDNALGVTGVSWNSSIMALKFLSASGSGTTADAIEAFAYADAMGADVISNSWGGWYEPSQAEYDAIAAMSDTLFVFAAGNDNKDITNFWPGGTIGGIYYPSNSGWYYHPASYDLDNILVVGASDASDAKAGFSNTSATRVDVFAPGVNTLSTVPGVVAIAPDAVENPIFSDSFSAGTMAELTNWMSVAYVYNKWALRTDAYTSESTSVAHVGYVNNEMSFLDQNGMLDLSAADVPIVRFRVRYDLETNRDYFYWGLYDPAQPEGAQFPILETYTGSTADQFAEVVYDLSAYAGRSDIALWFGLWSDGANASAQGYDGVWLDDVEVVDLDAGPSGSPWTVDYSTAYAYYNGTSMATPHVAGIAGLLLSLDPALTAEQLSTAITGSVDSKAALSGLCVTGGRVNAYTAVTAPIALADAFATEAPMAPAGVGLAAVPVPLEAAAPGVLGNDVDPNEDAILAELLDGPAHGSVDLAADGGFTYTPDAGYFGTDSFTYRAKDAGGTYSVPTAVELTVINLPPVGAADDYSTAYDTTLTAAAPGVLGNDTDPEATALHAELITGSADGDVVLASDGSFTFDPHAGFSGATTFTYSAVDTGDVHSAPVTVTVTVAPPVLVNDADAGVTFSRWVVENNASVSGGTRAYTYGSGVWTGSRMEVRFTGSAIGWVGPMGPTSGKADVYLDGVFQKRVDLYAPAVVASTTVWQSGALTEGRHTLAIVSVADKNAASSNYVVAVDGFELAGDTAAGYGTRGAETAGTYLGGWVKVAGNPTYTNSSYAYSYWSGARFIYGFTGTRVAWIGPKVSSYGRAAVYIDGSYKGVVSQYAPSMLTAYRAKVWESAVLPYGSHYLEIRPLGTKDAASSGTVVVIDAIDVEGAPDR